MKHHTRYQDIAPFITKDGSIIRELMRPETSAAGSAGLSADQQACRNQSLAEAIIPVNTKTLLHKHHQSEELYHVSQGQGLMTLNQQHFEVSAGDTICISPGSAHCIENTGEQDLKILCCCSPGYQHDDTELLIES